MPHWHFHPDSYDAAEDELRRSLPPGSRGRRRPPVRLRLQHPPTATLQPLPAAHTTPSTAPTTPNPALQHTPGFQRCPCSRATPELQPPRPHGGNALRLRVGCAGPGERQRLQPRREQRRPDDPGRVPRPPPRRPHSGGQILRQRRRLQR
ncbi:uncharacterized protein LOC125045673 isoform X1 [Penaeus chinensis]|uniref:uncharacterized protein LOC125045673 isoform X1 n=1 Tax=Penaeus chinensis TaxID=139456 RepID=UPI001FB6ED1C|nr:uncharacterized protein LOC125045673 isoform X1 [Penaeus chinensis]